MSACIVQYWEKNEKKKQNRIIGEGDALTCINA